jgi:hypothetical protein
MPSSRSSTRPARRLLVETFSREEARLFAREVIPALKERNATAA